jgi:hypothetical protein
MSSIFDPIEKHIEEVDRGLPIDAEFLQKHNFNQLITTHVFTDSYFKYRYESHYRGYCMTIYPSVFDSKHWVIRIEHKSLEPEVLTLKDRGMLIDVLDKIKFDNNE